MITLVISASLATLLGTLGAAAISGGVAAVSRKKSEQRQNQYNIDAEKRQQEYIDKQNEYNSPSEQMARYRAAGLNPYMVDDPGNQGEINSAIPNTASDYSDIVQDTSKQFVSGVDSFRNAYMQEKQYQLDVAKLEQQRQQAIDELEEKRYQFDVESSRKDIEHAYQVARDQINDAFRTKELELRNKNLTFEQEKEERRKLESDRDYNLRLAADSRNAQMHNLRVQYQQTQNKYNDVAFKKFEEEYNELWPDEKRNRKLVLAYENARKNLSPSALQSLTELEESLIDLRKKVTSNDITYQKYIAAARKLWDDFSSENHVTHYWDYDEMMSNPYKNVGAPIEIDAAAKLFGLFK